MRVFRKAGINPDGTVIVERVPDGPGGIVELVKCDNGVETHTLCNEGGLELAKAMSQPPDVDVDAIATEVVKRLDVPAMLADAAAQVRAELDLVEVTPVNKNRSSSHLTPLQLDKKAAYGAALIILPSFHKESAGSISTGVNIRN